MMKEEIVVGEEKSDFGTKEWSVQTRNICNGCPNGCWYCSACLRQSDCLGRIPKGTWTLDTFAWNRIAEPPKKVKSEPGKFDLMFPSTHDIMPHNVDIYITILLQELRAGKTVLSVSKPNFESINKVVAVLNQFPEYKDKVEFRFTITSDNPDLMAFWEPGAPDFTERLRCLQFVHEAGYRTSVSCEPALDVPNLEQLVKKLQPYVSDPIEGTAWGGIWIGPLNYVGHLRTTMTQKGVLSDPKAVAIFDAQEETQKPTPILLNLVQRLQAIPQVRFKDGGFLDILGIRPVAAALDRGIKQNMKKRFKDPKRVAAAHKAWATMRSRGL